VKQIVVGRGEVGAALAKVLGCDSYDLLDGDAPVGVYTVLHVALPWSDTFIYDVASYEHAFDAAVVVVYSTVPIGTCGRYGWVHSPVEGMHPHLAESLRTFTRFIGTDDPVKAAAVASVWDGIVDHVLLDSADQTEFLKLRSTARFGANLVFADYEYKAARQVGVPNVVLRRYDVAYNVLYRELGMGRLQRQVLHPPEGKIGGHCVVPNAKILNRQYPNPTLDMIIDMEG